MSLPRLRSFALTTILLAATALAGCTGGQSSDRDSDGDGLTDAHEQLTRTITVTREEGSVTLRVSSDPHMRDTDGDGLEDIDEMVRQTDPSDVDTDRDGLLDGFNVTLNATDANVAAWRALGVLESPPLTFLGELSFCRPLGLKSAQFSSDRPYSDQLSDGDELRGWNVTVNGTTRHVQGDPCTADADQDGAQDHEERAFGTDPMDPDTDGDGALDGYDLDPTADLHVRFDAIMIDRTNGTGVVTLTAAAGDDRAQIVADLAGALVINVPDTTVDGTTAPVQILLTATNAANESESVHLFPQGGTAVLEIDLATNATNLQGAIVEGQTVRAGGEDGRISFAWTLVRR